MRRSLELLGHERSSKWMCRSCCGSRYMLTLKLQISHNIDYLEFVDNVKTTLRWYRSGVSRVQPVTKAGFACRDGNGKPTRRSCLELGGRLQQQLELPESKPANLHHLQRPAANNPNFRTSYCDFPRTLNDGTYTPQSSLSTYVLSTQVLQSWSSATLEA